MVVFGAFKGHSTCKLKTSELNTNMMITLRTTSQLQVLDVVVN